MTYLWFIFLFSYEISYACIILLRFPPLGVLILARSNRRKWRDTVFAQTNMAGNITPPLERGGKCCIAGGPDKVSRRKPHKKSQVSRGYMGVSQSDMSNTK